MLALTAQHVMIGAHERSGTLPAFVKGFENIARDEHRHVAFGARFLRDVALTDPRYGDAIERTLAECVPTAESVLIPPWQGDQSIYFGFTVDEVRRFGRSALQRRLNVIGVAGST